MDCYKGLKNGGGFTEADGKYLDEEQFYQSATYVRLCSRGA